MTHPAAVPSGAQPCRVHPDRQTPLVCDQCGGFYCDQCLVEIQGKYLCAGCKATTVQALQERSSVNPRVVVILARVFAGVLVLGAVGSMVARAYYRLLIMRVAQIPSSDSLGYMLGEFLADYGFPLFTLAVALPPAIGLKRGAGWTHGWFIATLVAGSLSACGAVYCLALPLWPMAGVLLFYWLKPEVRSWVRGD